MAEPDEYEQNVLYEDGKFRVTRARDIESHNLWIGKCERDKRDYFFIPRGVLNELATTGDQEHAKVSLDTLTGDRMSHVLSGRSAGIDDLMLVFARVRIKELRAQLYYEHTKDIS